MAQASGKEQVPNLLKSETVPHEWVVSAQLWKRKKKCISWTTASSPPTTTTTGNSYDEGWHKLVFPGNWSAPCFPLPTRYKPMMVGCSLLVMTTCLPVVSTNVTHFLTRIIWFRFSKGYWRGWNTSPCLQGARTVASCQLLPTLCWLARHQSVAFPGFP